MSETASSRKGTSTRRKNVQVAVRIRPLNDRERAEGARVAVTANSVTGCIGVRERNSKKEFGPFDKVYDGSSRQHDIYEALVKPLIPQLLLGFNATIFAYGQTGTGKTFTMAGEPDPDHHGSWQDDPGMGVIPRALQQIFEELENQNAEEYAVRVSYVELYNEELFDLLARPGSECQRLRIYEDVGRKGSVIISGVEDVSVQSCEDVYEILRKGAEKRRTAATLMNMTSSRSHSVFSVTVITREGKTPGEDLMKTGKLHLVDLAGSENIGRSGAIDQRAREAGNINQSLLTLGRVITALTSGAQHIPYRESKLTRILQDSLGGKTITTIVATLSPSSTNTEESMNTLEYAARAKNIKNHPEANQTLSRKALLKAYNDEVERLKRDLQAAREKNGVFIDKDNFEKMQEELNAHRDQIEDFADRIQAYMAQIEKLMKDASMMDEQYSRLYGRSAILESRLADRRTEIEQLNLRLAEMEADRNRWKRAAEDVQDKFRTLQGQNEKMVATCSALSKDLHGSQQKIDYLSAVIARNEDRLTEFEKGYGLRTRAILSNAEAWKTSVSDNAEGISEHCGVLNSVVRERCSDSRNLLDAVRGDLSQWASSQEDAVNELRKRLEELSGQRSRELLNFVDITSDAAKNAYEQTVKHCQVMQSFMDDIVEQQNRFGLAFSDYINQTKKTDEEADCRRKQLNLQRTSVIGTFKADVLRLLEKFVSDGEAVQMDYSQMEAACSSQRNGALSGLEEAHSKTCDASRGSLEMTNQQSCDLVKTVDSMNQQIQKNNTAARNSTTAWADEVTNDTTVYSDRVVSTLKEGLTVSNGRCNDLKNTVNEIDSLSSRLIQEASQAAACIVESNEEQSSLLNKNVCEAGDDVRGLVNENIERPSSTGDTPKRRTYAFEQEMVDIQNVEDMVEGWKLQDEPRRQSFYRRRESILDTPSAVLSPHTLKVKLLSSVEEGDEDAETASQRSSIPHDFPAVNTRRRRALADHNAQ